MTSLPRLLIAITTIFLLTTNLLASTDETEAWIEHIDSYVNSNPDSALILCDEALASPRADDKSIRTALLTIRGNAHFTLGNYSTAITDFTAAVNQAVETADTIAIVNSLSDLGVAYRLNQQPDSAVVCYNRALALLEGHDSPDLEASILTSIAILFGNTKRLDDAIPFGRKAVEKAMLTDDIETQIYAASTLGSILFLNGNHSEGLATQRAIMNVAEKKGIPRYILKTYASIIAMHNRLENSDSVRFYIRRGEALLPKVPEASIESVGFMEQSSVILTGMGRYRESLDLQFRILGMKDSRPFMPEDLLWQRIALNYKGLGDIEKMSDAYTRAIAIADSIHSSDIDNQLSEFNVRYHTAEKELEISRLQTEKARQQTIIAVIVALIVIAGLLLALWLRSRRRKIELANIRAQLDGIEHERGRLAHELHDGVCNDLLGIELLFASPRTDRAELTSMLHNVRDEVRAISHELLPPKFNGLTIVQLLTAYARKSDGIVTFTSPATGIDLSPSDSIHLYRIVQEWTGNIRRHSDATAITVSLTALRGETILEITDNGSPFDPDATSGNGLGLDNISRRVKALRGAWTCLREGNLNVMRVKIFD